MRFCSIGNARKSMLIEGKKLHMDEMCMFKPRDHQSQTWKSVQKAWYQKNDGQETRLQLFVCSQEITAQKNLPKLYLTVKLLTYHSYKRKEINFHISKHNCEKHWVKPDKFIDLQNAQCVLCGETVMGYNAEKSNWDIVVKINYNCCYY